MNNFFTAIPKPESYGRLRKKGFDHNKYPEVNAFRFNSIYVLRDAEKKVILKTNNHFIKTYFDLIPENDL